MKRQKSILAVVAISCLISIPSYYFYMVEKGQKYMLEPFLGDILSIIYLLYLLGLPLAIVNVVLGIKLYVNNKVDAAWAGVAILSSSAFLLYAGTKMFLRIFY